MSYIDKLREAQRQGLFESGEVESVDVEHDGWCPRLDDGPCICDPDIYLDGEPLEVEA